MKGYDKGVNDMEATMHSSFADLYDDVIKEFPSCKDILSDVFVKIRDITTFNSKMLRGDTGKEAQLSPKTAERL